MMLLREICVIFCPVKGSLYICSFKKMLMLSVFTLLKITAHYPALVVEVCIEKIFDHFNVKKYIHM